MSLDLVQTVALAGVVLFAGYFIRRVITPPAEHNIPAPVVGGLLVAIVLTFNRAYVGYPIRFDTTLQAPLAIMLVVQVAAVALMAVLLVWPLMRRDYEAAVISSGFIGFMLGTTANAMVNMKAWSSAMGPRPRRSSWCR